MRARIRTLRWMLLLCAAASSPAAAQNAHDHAAAAPCAQAPPAAKGPGVIEVGRARLSISDAEVVDQDGKQRRFYSDLFKGRVVVLNTFFTRCTAVCPMQARVLAKLKAGLGEGFGREVFFVSVSRDPETDTPERLKRWGADFGVGPGWTLVTGEEDVMRELILDFTGGLPGEQLHSPLLLIGNDRTGVWTVADGLSPTAELIKVIDNVSGRSVK